MADPTRETRQKRSLFALIGDVPGLMVDLVKGELERLKNEIVGKLVNVGIGVGLLAVAGLFAFFALAVLVTAGVLGLAVVVPGWLSALIIGALLLVITLILVLVGIARVKHGLPPVPTETIGSVTKDVKAIKGIGKRGIS